MTRDNREFLTKFAVEPGFHFEVLYAWLDSLNIENYALSIRNEVKSSITIVFLTSEDAVAFTLQYGHLFS